MLVATGCSHEILWVGDEPSAVHGPDTPVGMTVAVGARAFDNTRLRGSAVVERFARTLRDAALFQGVMYPIPAGVSPTWEIELIGEDATEEPDSNFWKAALATAIPLAAPFVTLEEDYVLRLEALVLRDRHVIATYAGEAHVQKRYGIYADKRALDADGLERAVGGASRALLSALAADLDTLLVEDHRL